MGAIDGAQAQRIQEVEVFAAPAAEKAAAVAEVQPLVAPAAEKPDEAEPVQPKAEVKPVAAPAGEPAEVGAGSQQEGAAEQPADAAVAAVATPPTLDRDVSLSATEEPTTVKQIQTGLTSIFGFVNQLLPGHWIPAVATLKLISCTVDHGFDCEKLKRVLMVIYFFNILKYLPLLLFQALSNKWTVTIKKDKSTVEPQVCLVS